MMWPARHVIDTRFDSSLLELRGTLRRGEHHSMTWQVTSGKHYLEVRRLQVLELLPHVQQQLIRVLRLPRSRAMVDVGFRV